MREKDDHIEPIITQRVVRKLFDYNPETGVLMWRTRDKETYRNAKSINAFNARLAGKIAGGISTCRSGKRYANVKIFGTTYRQHRIIWLFMTGAFPKEEIDHIDGDGLNNSFINLREASSTDNSRNQKRFKTNKSGFVGVSWNKGNRKWAANIYNNGQIHLGYFKNKTDAINARCIAEVKYGYHENHGTVRQL